VLIRATPKLEPIVHDQAARIIWIRSPDLVTHLAAMSSPGRDTEAWRNALAVFPDIHAAGKFIRLLLWSALRRVVKPKANLINDWDDIHYVFLASYSGHIATADRGVMEMAQAIFPDVSVDYRSPN